MKLVIVIILIFVLVDVLMVGYVLYRHYLRRLPAKTIKNIQTEWRRIIDQEDHCLAIMEADKLLDHALFEMGLRGSLGAKLKKAPKLFSNINGVWSAHKIRNNIAHQINYQVDIKIYKKTMLQFKKAFEDLKIF